MITPGDHAAFRALLERSRLYVLVTHVNPDGDAIGSQVGLGRYLQSMGFEVRIVNQDETPHDLRFLEFDGPYAEAKEQLGGYHVIDVPDLDTALAWAARCPSAARGAVEVRPMSSNCGCNVRHDSQRPMVFPGGWLVTCLACGRRWLELQ